MRLVFQSINTILKARLSRQLVKDTSFIVGNTVKVFTILAMPNAIDRNLLFHPYQYITGWC
ncbi:hypothetical protein [Syntrophomonas wolfei]|uniref:hypothetical protein n=1 Tax=Syntrophomonas wolfei TaxID=863 RepID=UPI00031A107F|nr:hypothetical protein [Syntrophomonas wolfei]